MIRGALVMSGVGAAWIRRIVSASCSRCSMLRMAAAASIELIPEIGELISQVDLVQVKVYEGAAKKDPAIGRKVDGLIEKLAKDGWRPMVRVPEENVNILLKTDGDNIAGFTVQPMAQRPGAFELLVGAGANARASPMRCRWPADSAAPKGPSSVW